jgi:hypothetical protein
MLKFALCCMALAPAAFSSAAFAGDDTGSSAQNRAPIIVAQVGIGTPDCHIQGTLWRAANGCPPEAIAEARQQHPIRPYWQRHWHHASRWQRHHAAALAHRE